MSKKTKDNVKDPLIFETAYRRDTAAHLDEEIEKRYPGKYHEQELLTEYPTVYIIDNQGKQSNYKEDYTVYVGETIDIGLWSIWMPIRKHARTGKNCAMPKTRTCL